MSKYNFTKNVKLVNIRQSVLDMEVKVIFGSVESVHESLNNFDIKMISWLI